MGNQDILSFKSAIRADKWLCAVRFFKTRTLAAKACDGGKVRKKKGEALKASTKIKEGDVLLVPGCQGRCLREIYVLKVIEKRVSAPEAALCYEDKTPEEVVEKAREEMRELRQNRMELGIGGRMSKRDRRVWEKAKDDNRGFF